MQRGDQVAHHGRGNQPELTAEHAPVHVVLAHGLRHVALGQMHLHELPMCAFPQRFRGHRRQRQGHRLPEPAGPAVVSAQRLQHAQPHLPEAFAMDDDPFVGPAGEQVRGERPGIEQVRHGHSGLVAAAGEPLHPDGVDLDAVVQPQALRTGRDDDAADRTGNAPQRRAQIARRPGARDSRPQRRRHVRSRDPVPFQGQVGQETLGTGGQPRVLAVDAERERAEQPHGDHLWCVIGSARHIARHGTPRSRNDSWRFLGSENSLQPPCHPSSPGSFRRPPM
jgi:hypothetical protein